MSSRRDPGDSALADEAARLICDERYTDYRTARSKAAERLGISTRQLPFDGLRIESAVLERQRLFGGQAYLQRLRGLRETALQAMHLLASFNPRLVGGAVSGAIGEGHRVQLHVFADQAELVEMLLHDRRIPFEQAERRYRFADGREESLPLLRFEAGGLGLDIAVFETGDERQAPLSPVDGKPTRRLTADQVRGLLND